MENKQTAVDFLLHELSEIIGIIAPDAFRASIMKIKYEQAKAMEKEQIMKANIDGYEEAQNYGETSAEQYYEQTYGK